jgi:hypothetical protein
MLRLNHRVEVRRQRTQIGLYAQMMNPTPGMAPHHVKRNPPPPLPPRAVMNAKTWQSFRRM